MPEAVRESSIDAARVGVRQVGNFQLTRYTKEKKKNEGRRTKKTKKRKERINNEKG